jgi:hypothetical protein
MKFLKYLNEEYLCGFELKKYSSEKFSCGYTEVFKNPSSKEMREVSKLCWDWWPNRLRFIADLKKKNLFIFKADSFHDDVSQELVTIGEIKNPELCIRAVARVNASKLHFESIDEMERIKLFNNYNDTWTKKYFDEQLSLSCKRV